MYRELGLQRSATTATRPSSIPPSFSLAGGARKCGQRQAVQRLQRKGYTAEAGLAGSLTLTTRDELLGLEGRGSPDARARASSWSSTSCSAWTATTQVFVVGRDISGQLVGFLELAVCPASRLLSLSTMPRSPLRRTASTPFSSCTRFEWAAANGYLALSLNFASRRASSARTPIRTASPDSHDSACCWRKRALGLQLDDLLSFNQRRAPLASRATSHSSATGSFPRVVTAAISRRALPTIHRLAAREGLGAPGRHRR